MININVFILDENMEKSVIYHPDKHIVKMPVEGVQLLCNTFHNIGNAPNWIYKPSHKYHPLNKWASESLDNWLWLKKYVLLMGEEYSYRYGRKHKSVELCSKLPIPNIHSIGMTPFVKCVPDEFKNLNVVDAYRDYFIKYKQHLKKYTKRDIPDWWV